ncbi:MAG: homogentisate 1,2-dioxygenase [Polyangiales bacterium]|nr:homogentisate 1,2-dioxygenase [Myxococcales bacterium]MCB9661995.1 homogentisate 1,2-dioxygenase [Sandaracinaceae bacterium]
MKSFFHPHRGNPPRQAHVDIGDLKEDEIGRQGFSGRMAQLYRRNDPQRYKAHGALRCRRAMTRELAVPDQSDPRALPLRLLENEDCAVSLSKRSAPMPFYTRHLDGDAAYFVHQGTGLFETEFGPLRYEPGDYLVMPKAVTFRIVPDGVQNHFYVLETSSELTIPDYGPFGRHAPLDPSTIEIPEAHVIDDPNEWEIVLQHDGGSSSITYKHNPCDVEAWKGDLFPFRFNIRDWNVVSSDTLHLPPPVHQLFGARGVVLCNFLPRPAEGRKGAERVPVNHRNVDYDEVIFVHGGSFLGAPLGAGMLEHDPQGLHHGAPEKARAMARQFHDNVSRVEWQIVALETSRRLRPTAAFLEAAGG